MNVIKITTTIILFSFEFNYKFKKTIGKTHFKQIKHVLND